MTSEKEVVHGEDENFATKGHDGESGPIVSTEMLDESNDVEDIDCVLCAECGGTPCYWEQLRVSIISAVEHYCNSEKLDEEDERKDGIFPGASNSRKVAYRTYVGERYRFLGPGNRV